MVGQKTCKALHDYVIMIFSLIISGGKNRARQTCQMQQKKYVSTMFFVTLKSAFVWLWWKLIQNLVETGAPETKDFSLCAWDLFKQIKEDSARNVTEVLIYF